MVTKASSDQERLRRKEELDAKMNQFANDITKMKTDNMKMVTQINEMSILFEKANDLMRVCVNSQNESLRQLEKLQFNFNELRQKSEEGMKEFNAVEIEEANEKSNQPVDSINKKPSAKLKMILDDSIDRIDDNQKQPTKASKLIIPDTCVDDETDYLFTNRKNATKAKSSLYNLVITNTLASNGINQHKGIEKETDDKENDDELDKCVLNDEFSVIQEEDDMEEDLDETEGNEPKNLRFFNHQKYKQISTPLSVKKQLQEHGLLDETNSPQQQQKQQISSDKAQSSVVNKQATAATPTKYIQKQFSPIKQLASSASTPVKQLTLITPTKSFSPSLTKKSSKNGINQLQLAAAVVFQQQVLTKEKETSDADEVNKQHQQENEEDDYNSLDFSYEFRAMKSTQQGKSQDITKKSSVNAESSSKANGLTTTNSKKNKQNVNVNIFSNNSKKTNNSNDLTNEIPSPAKQSAKRFKQLTMAESFSTKNKPTMTTSTTVSSDISKLTVNELANENQRDETQVDLDETWVPPDLLQNTQPNNKTNEMHSNVNIKREPKEATKKEIHTKPRAIKDEPIDEIEDVDFTNSKYSTGNEKKTSESEFLNDFDKIPRKPNTSPPYKHVQVFRKQDERKKLNAMSCRDCEAYWNSLPEDKRPKRMDELCRHRYKYQAPPTPENFWEIEFPTTQQCIERGYGGAVVCNDKDDSLGTKRLRRKRPLKLITNNGTTSGKGVNEWENEDNNDEKCTNNFDFGD